MKKSILAGILGLMLIFSGSANALAMDSDVIEESAIIVDETTEETVPEEIATEENTNEIVSEESATEETTEEPTEYAIEYEDITENLFRFGAISPEYGEIVSDYVSQENQGNIEIVGEGGSIYELYNYIYDRLKARATTIDITEYSDFIKHSDEQTAKNNFKAMYAGILDEHPEMLYVLGSYSFSTYRSGNYSYVGIIYPNYSTTNYDFNLLDSEINKALAVVKDGMTDEQKVIALHEYLVLNCEYDKERLNNGSAFLQKDHPDAYNMYGVLVDKIAVCQGYAETFKYLLNRCGLTAHIVSSSNINHAWNIVKLDGAYYQIDTTWDDPTWDRFGQSHHSYMLKSDAAFGHLKDGYAKDWKMYANYQVANIVATSTKYDNAYWNGITSPMVLHDQYYYYMKYQKSDYSSKVYIARNSSVFSNSATEEMLYGDVGLWYVSGSSGSYWQVSGGGVYEINGKLFFNSSTAIFSMSYDDFSVKKELDLSANDGKYVYGSMYRDGSIYYVRESGPSHTARQTIYKADFDLSAMKYNILFYANDGTDRSGNYIFKCGVTYSISSITFDREGYTLVNWNTKADGTGTTYELDARMRDVMPADGKMSLYAQWEKIVVAEDAAKIMGTSIKYDGSLSIFYTFQFTETVIADKDAYILVSGDKTYIKNLTTETNNNEVNYKLTLNVAVKDLNDYFDFSVYMSDGTKCILRNNSDKQYANDEFSYSAANYLKTIVTNSSGTYSQKSVVYAKALLDYATCADAYFDNKEEAHIDNVDAVSKDSLAKYEKVVSGNADGITYLGSSLILENTTKIRHYFMLGSGYSESSYKVSLIREGSPAITVSLQSRNGLYYYDVSYNAPLEFVKMNTLSISSSSGDTLSIKYGMYSYAYDALNTSVDARLISLVKAMYLYGEVEKNILQ